MKNYNEKKRDMCRSVLPSTRAKGARDNAAAIKRRNRRKNNNVLRDWMRFENAYDCEHHTYDYIYGWAEDQNIKMNMWERRNGDKIAPLMRWAETITKRDLAHLSNEDKRMYFTRILPDNLIGRHALSHLEGRVFEYRNPYLYYYAPPTDEERARAAAWREEHKRRFVNKVRDLVIKDHALLNARLPGCPIEGLHAVEEWCRTISPAARNIIDGMTP